MKQLLLPVLFCLFSSVAHADVIPPSVAECSSKKEGDACADPTGAGVCQSSTCSRLDYSQGSPPKGTIEYPCLKCAPAPAAPTSGNTTAKVDPPSKTKGCAVDPINGAGALSALMFLSGLLLLRRRETPR